MSAVVSRIPSTAAPVAAGAFDRWSAVLLAGGLLVMFWPVFATLAAGTWASDEQGHVPVILALAGWLAWRKRAWLALTPYQPNRVWGWSAIAFGLALYWIGRSQDVLMFATSALIPVCAGLVLLTRGAHALRLVAFPLFLLVFIVPLPGTLVAAVTAPLKTAVSLVSTTLLYHLGLPVARSGVVMMVGQYQLLVADACAGLNSMFTLEAIGLVYMSLRNHASLARNVILAVLLVPVAFCANVVRVMILVGVTYVFGDAAGQGFVHGFAGVVLFVVAVVLMMGIDALLGLHFHRRRLA